MQPRPDRLEVYYGSDLVGAVHDSAPLAFKYASTWLEAGQRMSLAAIPLQPGRQATPAVQAFFENLLPEGELRDYLAAQRKASTLFSLLLEVAGDTAGAFVLVAPGQTPEPPRYEATSWEAIAAALARRSASAIDIRAQGARISLAGAQDKTSLAIFDDGVPRLPKGTSPSTHILKPDIRRLAKVWHSAANEAIVMRAAALAGLPTAEVFYEPRTEACVVRRFDRQLRPDGTLARLVQYDLCQLAGTVSERKYEKEGGPGLAACAELIRRYSAQPAVDLRHLVRWVFFNLYVGNNDSHAKSLSIYSVPGQGVTLTPFYDLMCTRLYPGPVARVRVCDRRRGEAGRDGSRAPGADGQAAGYATALPDSAGTGHGRPRAHGHRPGYARNRALAHAIGTHTGRTARALRRVHDQEAGSSPDRLTAAAEKTDPWERSPTKSPSSLASSSPASPGLPRPSSSSFAGRRRRGKVDAPPSASRCCVAQATRCENSSTKPSTI